MSVATRTEEERYQEVRALALTAPGAAQVLVEALYDESWRVRRAAAERFCQLPAPGEAVPALVQVLADRDQTGARNAAAEALVALGELATGALLELLRHPDADQRKFAADCLGQLRRPEPAQALIRALEDSDPNVRNAAAEALGRTGDVQAARALEGVLGQDDVLLRLCALEALFELRHPPPLPVIASTLGEPVLQRAGYRLLGRLAEPAAAELACRGVAHELGPTRDAALGALGSMWSAAAARGRPGLGAAIHRSLRRTPEVVEVLRRALRHEAVEVRCGAVAVAEQLRELSLIPALLEAAHEPLLVEPVTRALGAMGVEAAHELLKALPLATGLARLTACEALVELADPSLVGGLVELASRGEAELTQAALRALGRCRSSEAIAPLVGSLDHPEHDGVAVKALLQLSHTFRAPVVEALERRAAGVLSPAVVAALAGVAGVAALPVLRRASRDQSPAVRSATAPALAQLGPDGQALLRLLLSDEAPEVRCAALRAVSTLGPEQAGPLVETGLVDAQNEVRLAAVEAAGASGVVAAAPALLELAHAADGQLALCALRALSRLGKLTDAALDEASRHPDSEVVKEALSQSAARQAGVRVALSSLNHPRWDVRVAAARALAAAGDRSCLVAVRTAASAESEPLVLEALEQAVARLSQR